jgi:hypothetical protein
LIRRGSRCAERGAGALDAARRGALRHRAVLDAAGRAR